MAKSRDLKPGTLVRVQEWAVEDDKYLSMDWNNLLVKENGWLWVVIRHDDGECAYCNIPNHTEEGIGTVGHIFWCKSLSTGKEERFYARELGVCLT